MVFQHIVNGLFHFFGCGGQVNELFRTAVNLASLEVHDALAKCLVGCVLFGGLKGGVHIQAACVSFLAVLRKHQLANCLGHVLCVNAIFVRARSNFQRFCFGFLCLLGRDETILFHALNDVELA